MSRRIVRNIITPQQRMALGMELMRFLSKPESERKKFETWPLACQFFSRVMGFPIVKTNLHTAMKALDVEPSVLIAAEAVEKTFMGRIHAQYRDLEARVAELERKLS